jgi:hypothetical protein
LNAGEQFPKQSQSESKSSNTVKQNSDNDDLLPWQSGDGGWRIGYVGEVNGPGAEEISGFVPTRHESIVIAKHWMRVQLDEEYFCFLTSSSGSSTWRRVAFAGRRIERLAGLLGEQAVTDAWEEVRKEFAEGQDPESVDIFLNGNAEQQEALQEKFHQIEQAEQQIHTALSHDTEAAGKMIEFLHRFRDGRSITDILRDPPDAAPGEEELKGNLLRILKGDSG